MALLTTFFALTGVWFWLVFLVFLVLEVVMIVDMTDDEKIPLFWPGILIILMFLGVTYGNSFHPALWMKANGGGALAIFIGYFVLGSTFMLLKFWRLVRIKTAEFARILRIFEKTNPEIGAKIRAGTELAYAEKETWEKKLKSEWKLSIKNWGSSEPVPIRYKKHMRRLSYWLLYWPFSLIWTILGDYLLRIGEHIINILRGAMNAISVRVAQANGIAVTRVDEDE